MWFSGKKTSGLFNETNADARASHLLNAMTQAFYRREHDTVDMYAKQGAPFTHEMLMVAVNFADPRLCGLCLEKGVKPTDEIFALAYDRKDPETFGMLAARGLPSDEMQARIRKHGSTDMQEALEKARQQHSNARVQSRSTLFR